LERAIYLHLQAQPMTSRVAITILILLVIVNICFGQNGFKGLQPGKSKRTDVEGTLGQAVREISSLSEHKSDNESEKIFVHYRQGSDEVARIELVYPDTVERASVMRSFKLPASPTASQKNAKGQLEEYFSTKLIVLTSTTDSNRISSVGYYSTELFEKAIAKLGSKILGPDLDDPSTVVEKPSSGISSGAQRPEGPEKAAKVKVPSVVTLRAMEAKAALEGDGLHVAFVAADTNPPSKEQAFTIQRQEPAGGEEVDRATTVKLTIYGPFLPGSKMR
jgi:hypothetical protein